MSLKDIFRAHSSIHTLDILFFSWNKGNRPACASHQYGINEACQHQIAIAECEAEYVAVRKATCAFCINVEFNCPRLP